MTLWFMLALMTAAAVFAVLWPLARRGRATVSGSDVVVYRDQLDEIRRDREAGRIGDSEARAAQVEVSRRLLEAADAANAAPATASDAVVARRRRTVAVAALAALPLGALAVYLALGSPSLPGQPLASRMAVHDQSIERLIAQVEERLSQNPKDGRGWEVIAPIYLRLGRYDDAVRARRNALALNGESAERYAGLGEALVAAANGIVTAEAKAAFEAAIKLDAEDVRTRYFLGLAAEQDGKPDAAAAIWRAMLASAPPDAPWIQVVRNALMRVGGAGPNEEQVAAAGNLPPEQQRAMIEGMVARLAERLQRDGSDVDGWLRLVRSYMVLGEREKALAAAGHARRALAGDPDKLRRIDEFIKGLGLKG
ncbi:MAG: c-type cytochrome biogenesis protein CcmI [Xanthobacteraceae bacterium]